MLLSSMLLDVRSQLTMLLTVRWPRSGSGWWRLALACVLWLCLIAGAVLLVLAALQSWRPVVLALVAGVLAAWGVQWGRAARLLFAKRLPEWVSCSFEDGRLECLFDEALLHKWVCAWPWRVVTAVVAGLACFGMQRVSVLQAGLLPLKVTAMAWLMLVVRGAGVVLPVAVAGVFLWATWLLRGMAGHAKRALARRAALAQERIGRTSEIDGFDAAMEVLFAQFYRERPTTYRSAIENRLKAEPALAVMQPESMATMLKAVTEVARQDMRNAAGALESVRRVEKSAHVLQSLSSVLREPLVEVKAEQFVSRQRELGELVARRQWEELEREAQELEKEIGEARALLRERSVRSAGALLTPGMDPYSLLGVDASASTAAIKKLRLRLAQVYHPDIGGETSNAAKMAELNAAYDAVMRERERR